MIYFKPLFLDSPCGVEERNEKAVATTGHFGYKASTSSMSSTCKGTPEETFFKKRTTLRHRHY